MDVVSPIPFPDAPSDPLEHDLAEIDAAIALVATGRATRVRLVSIACPDAVAATGLAHAQAAGLIFRLDRHGRATAVTVGPRA